MQLFNIVFERMPMVWFLLGLLFNSLALYLGIEHPLFFVYLVLGWGSCAYGLALYFLRKFERPKQAKETRLSPNFISLGDTNTAPTVKTDDEEVAAEPSSEQ